MKHFTVLTLSLLVFSAFKADKPDTKKADCTLSSSISITAPISCNGGITSANADPLGGTAPFTFSWSNGSFASNASGLSAGTYSVLVTDNSGCTASASVNITQPAALNSGVTSANINCYGNNNGSASSSPTGGTSPYAYVWTNGTGGYWYSSSIGGLNPGNYTLYVNDANGCGSSASVVITQPSAPLNVTIPTFTNVTCFNGNNGGASANVNGGTSPYTYSWNPGGKTTVTATGLSSGGYTLTVTDNNGCTATTSVTINEPTTPIMLWFTWINNPTCLSGDSSGAASLNAVNGVGTYSYSWSNGKTTTNNSLTDLSTGSYTVTVFDGNGCTATTSVFLDTLNIDINNVINASCYAQANGSANVMPNNGQPPYTFSWSSGSTFNFANGLSAGSYSVTVWDFHGCIVTASVIITQPPVLTASIAATNVSCNSGNNGLATVTAGGGTSPYTYSWSPVYGTNATIYNLATNVYTVNVRDANGCNATASVLIWAPAMLGGWVAGSNVLCYGGNSGSAMANPTNGTSPYTYSWNPGGQTTATATSLTIGNYTVTIKDSCNASFTSAVYISQPDIALNVTADEYTGVTCYGGSTGAVRASSGGGTPGYTFLWSPGGNTNGIATGLAVGTYTVTETDHNGCTATASVALTGNTPVVANITAHHDVSCHADSDGYLFGLGSGGLGGYHNLWSNGGINTLDPNLKAGTYSLQVTDAGGCVGSTAATVTQPAGLSARGYSAYGYAAALVWGGTAPYTYLWSPSGGTKAYISGLSGGTYTVTVHDSHGCVTSASIKTNISSDRSSDTSLILSLANPIISCGTFEFDIMASSNMPSYFDFCEFYLRYSNGAFGDSIATKNNIFITGGANFISSTYENPNQARNDYGPDTVHIYFGTEQNQSSWNRTQLNSTPQQLLHIQINVKNCDSAIAIAFTDTLTTSLWSEYNPNADSSSASDIFYDTTYYTGEIINLSACKPALDVIPYPINAGTNAVSVPANSSILTITGTGFGNTMGWINVPDANSGGSRKFNLDTCDILSWANNKIVIKMPSYMKHDLGTPGSGKLTVHNNCGYSDSTDLTITYNIENSYPYSIFKKMRNHIVMKNHNNSLVFRCDTSISHNAQAYACVKKAIREWNCWTGVNWTCGSDTMLDTTLRDGISNIYFSNWNFTPASGLMVTLQQPSLSCDDEPDSILFYNEADIQIKRGRFLPGGKQWNYDTTGTIVSNAYDYFYDCILHELGHAHGLGHINDRNSLMFYLFSGGRRYDSITIGTFAVWLGAMDEIHTSTTFTTVCGDSTLRPDTVNDICYHRDCHCPSGIANIFQNSNTISLYPNPAGQTVNIEYQLTGNAYICFKITDCLGRVIMELNNGHKTAGSYIEEANINKLAQGVYFFIANINGELKTIKFIKI